VEKTGFEPVTTSGMVSLTASEVAASRIQLLAIASSFRHFSITNLKEMLSLSTSLAV